MGKPSITLRVSISELNANEERVHELSTLLISNIQDSNLDLIVEKQPTTLLLQGAKGDPFTVGALILVTIPTLLPQLLGFLQGWLVERRKVSIEAPNGMKVEFTPAKKLTEEEILALAKKMNKIQPAKAHKHKK
jgi:hypothetical protein